MGNKGFSILGSLVAVTILSIAFTSYLNGVAITHSNLKRLQLLTTEQLIIFSLKASAYSAVGLKNTGAQNPFVNKCILSAQTCLATTGTPVNWYNGVNNKIAGTSGQMAFYDKNGQICVAGSVAGKQCPFSASSVIKFVCSASSDSCDLAESAIINFALTPHSSIARYIKREKILSVNIPTVATRIIASPATAQQPPAPVIVRSDGNSDGDGDGDGN